MNREKMWLNTGLYKRKEGLAPLCQANTLARTSCGARNSRQCILRPRYRHDCFSRWIVSMLGNKVPWVITEMQSFL